MLSFSIISCTEKSTKKNEVEEKPFNQLTDKEKNVVVVNNIIDYTMSHKNEFACQQFLKAIEIDDHLNWFTKGFILKDIASATFPSKGIWDDTSAYIVFNPKHWKKYNIGFPSYDYRMVEIFMNYDSITGSVSFPMTNIVYQNNREISEIHKLLTIKEPLEKYLK